MIESNQLGVRFSTGLVLKVGDLEKRTKAVVLLYEIFHKSWSPDTVVESGSFAKPVVEIGTEMLAIDEALWNKTTARLEEVRTHHEPISAIDGHSLFDADLILDGWQFWQDSAQWHAAHPVSGSFSGALDPTLTNRVNALLSLVLPPPAWTWIDSISSGTIRTQCVEVPGADHYAIYDAENAYLGNVADHTLQALPIGAGSHLLRMAAVRASGRVGVMSQTISVTVG